MPEDEKALLGRGVSEASNVDRQIEDLTNLGLNHMKKLNLELSWAQHSASISGKQAAQINLKNLSKMAVHLEGAYVNSSIALREYAGTSDDLKWINRGLGLCYLVLAVSKVTDAVAQFCGPGAKLITSLKTPITDLSVEGTKPLIGLGDRDSYQRKEDTDPNFKLVISQTLNLTMMGMTKLPDGQDLEDVQKEFGAIIDLCKDFSSLLSTPKDLKVLKADFGLWCSKAAEKAAKPCHLSVYQDTPEWREGEA
jgi:hypothetical protein